MCTSRRRPSPRVSSSGGKCWCPGYPSAGHRADGHVHPRVCNTDHASCARSARTMMSRSPIGRSANEAYAVWASALPLRSITSIPRVTSASTASCRHCSSRCDSNSHTMASLRHSFATSAGMRPVPSRCSHCHTISVARSCCDRERSFNQSSGESSNRRSGASLPEPPAVRTRNCASGESRARVADTTPRGFAEGGAAVAAVASVVTAPGPRQPRRRGAIRSAA